MSSLPIKVAYLDYSSIFAGAERALCTIVNNLDRQQVTPIVVFPYPMQHHEMYHLNNTEVFYLSSEKKWWMGSEYWKHALRGADILKRCIFGIKLARLLQREKVDILHINLLRPDSFLWVCLAKWSGVKIVGHFRSQSDSWIPKKRVQKCCHEIVCVSHFNRERLLSKGKWASSQVVYDTVDIQSLNSSLSKEECRKMLGVPRDSFLISSVGQLQPHKGHDKAIMAFKAISDKYPKVFLYIAGGGATSELNRLHGLADGISCIYFSGKQIDAAIVYKASDLILSLTQVGEAFGLVPHEAAYMRVPFIAPEWGAVTEFYKTKESGLLVNTHNVAEIAEIIEWSIQNATSISDLVSAAHKIVCSRLVPSNMVQCLTQVYKELA